MSPTFGEVAVILFGEYAPVAVWIGEWAMIALFAAWLVAVSSKK